MNMHSHRRIISQGKWFIVLFTLAVTLAAFVFVVSRPDSYAAVVSFDVHLINRPATADYQYGAYYDLKGAEIESQHLMSWFMTPAVVRDIYDTAAVPYAIDSIGRFTNRFKAKQYSAQNFAVSFTDYNQDTAQRLAEAIVTVITQRTQADPGSQFAVTALPPVIAPQTNPVWLVTVVGLCTGLIGSVILLYLREYLRA